MKFSIHLVVVPLLSCAMSLRHYLQFYSSRNIIDRSGDQQTHYKNVHCGLGSDFEQKWRIIFRWTKQQYYCYNNLRISTGGAIKKMQQNIYKCSGIIYKIKPLQLMSTSVISPPHRAGNLIPIDTGLQTGS